MIMRDGGLNLTEEQAWILRKIIEAAVQLLANEEDIKKCGNLARFICLSKKFDTMVTFINVCFLTLQPKTKLPATKFTGSWWYKKIWN